MELLPIITRHDDHLSVVSVSESLRYQMSVRRTRRTYAAHRV